MALLPVLCPAQTLAPDSSRVSYGEEMLPASPLPESRLGRQYSKLTRLQTEENRLWKLGLNNFSVGYISYGDSLVFSRYGVHLAYEQKLRPAWSVLGEVSPDILRYQSSNNGGVRIGFALRTQLAGRYYYNLNRRIRKAKSASNFSANYISLALGAGFGRRADNTHFYSFSRARAGQAARLSGVVLYGLQRRLGRYGFVDFNFGVPFALSPNPRTSSDGANFLPITTTLRIGLALGR